MANNHQGALLVSGKTGSQNPTRPWTERPVSLPRLARHKLWRMYDFANLSPLDFEELVRDLLQAELRRTLESFGPGVDRGIDFRLSKGRGLIVQAKHYLRSGAAALLRSLAQEDRKVKALKPRPRRYVLATSVSMTPALKDRIIAAMPSTPLAPDDIFGLEDLNNLLRHHDEIERQHFKLWLTSTSVLERILKSGVYHRTEAEMGIIRDMVPRFVQNRSVSEAETVLSELGTLVIAGEPGVGKSTLARMLVWLHAAQGWRIFVVDDIRDAYDVANEGEKRLIFFDDFLGQVRLSTDFVRGMDQRLPPFLDRVQRNRDLRFILTTRDYILSRAQLLSARLAGPAITKKRYVLDVGTYTRGARARILYNHLHFSDLAVHDKASLLADDFFLGIIDHPNFNPRLIETLTNADYAIVAGEPIRDAVERVLDNPQELWERPYRQHLTDEARALLLAVLFNTRDVALTVLQESFGRMARALELRIARADQQALFRHALRETEGSIIAISQRSVTFANPGVRDFLQATVIADDVLPPVIEQVATYDELRQCWTIWNGEANATHRTESDQRRWIEALDRLLAGTSGTVLKRLEMAIDIYDAFESEPALERVRSVREALSDSDLDTDDVRAICYALENAQMSLLPLADLDANHAIVTAKAAALLEDLSYALPLDEVDALDDALHRYGSDPIIAARASQTGIAGFIKELEQHLDDIGSVSDLDSFETDLSRVMLRRGLVDATVKRDVQSRRERLQEAEDENDDDNYTRSKPAATESEMTSAQIRSMFSSLSPDLL